MAVSHVHARVHLTGPTLYIQGAQPVPSVHGDLTALGRAQQPEHRVLCPCALWLLRVRTWHKFVPLNTTDRPPTSHPLVTAVSVCFLVQR